MGFAVFTDFRVGRDEVLKALQDQKDASAKFRKQAIADMKRVTAKATNVRKVMAGVLAAGAVRKGFRLLETGVRGVIGEISAFDDALTQAGTRFGAFRGTEGFIRMKNAARALGAETRYSAAEAGNALNFFAKAGFNVAQSIASMSETADFATAVDLDLARASDIATDSLGALQLRYDAVSGAALSAEQTAKNFSRVTNVMAFTANEANLGIEEMFDTLRRAAPDAVKLGAEVEDLSALIRGMADNGIKGQLAAVPLRNAFKRLTSPVRGVKSALKELNVEIADSDKNMRSFLGDKKDTGILEDIQKGLKKFGQVKQSQLLKKLFGDEGSAGIQAIVGLPVKVLREYRAEAQKTEGVTKKLAKEMEKSLTNRWKKIRSVMIEKGLKIFDQYEDQIPALMDTIEKSIRDIDVKPIVEGINDTIHAIKNLYNFINDHKTFIKGVIAAWVSFSLLLKGLSVVKTVNEFRKLTKAILATKAAQEALSRAKAPMGAGSYAGGASLADKVGGGLAAAGVGATIGTAIHEFWLGPQSREAANRFAQLSSKSAAAGIASSDAKFKMQELARINVAMRELPSTLASMENGMGNVAAIFTDVASPFERLQEALAMLKDERKKLITSINVQQAQQLVTNSAVKQLGDAAHNAASALQRGGNLQPPNAASVQLQGSVVVDSRIQFDGAPPGVSGTTTARKKTAPLTATDLGAT